MAQIAVFPLKGVSQPDSTWSSLKSFQNQKKIPRFHLERESLDFPNQKKIPGFHLERESQSRWDFPNQNKIPRFQGITTKVESPNQNKIMINITWNLRCLDRVSHTLDLPEVRVMPLA